MNIDPEKMKWKIRCAYLIVAILIAIDIIANAYWVSELPPLLNAVYLSLMVFYLRASMKQLDEESFRKEINSIMRQNCVFLISVLIELISVGALRFYRYGLQSTCKDITHREQGCDLNSTKNFTSRMIFLFLDTLSKFTYCMYFLWV